MNTKLWDMVMALDKIEDRADFHPERNQLNHTVQVALAAAEETGQTNFHLVKSYVSLLQAAVLHDVGKAVTFAEKGNAHGHEAASVALLKDADGVFDNALWLISNHIRVAAFLDGTMTPKKAKMLMADTARFADLCALRRFDLRGRKADFFLTTERRAAFENVCRRVGIEVGEWPS